MEGGFNITNQGAATVVVSGMDGVGGGFFTGTLTAAADSPYMPNALKVQVKQLLEPAGGATPEHRRAYEAALQEEKEARIATGCVGGGAI